MSISQFPPSDTQTEMPSHPVGLIVHRSRREAWNFAHQVIEWLGEWGREVLLDPDSAEKLDLPNLAAERDRFAQSDFVITLGGDGTILTAARFVASTSAPILGVHMGRFGFIAETHPEDLRSTLERVVEGDYETEDRVMLCAEVLRNGEKVLERIGLNDALIKSGVSQMTELRTWLGGAPFATFHADGLIVATPTGSTAYALSAGGPLVMPRLNALVLVPVSPHTLSARPMVVPGDEVIMIETRSEGDGAVFAVDGLDPFPLEFGDQITVRKAACVTRLICGDRSSFYRKVRNRYLYGERLNE